MTTSARIETPLLIAFLDLSRFSNECEQRTNAAIAETMDAYYGLLAQAVAAANGRVVKYIGDAALVVFPESAVDRAVLALVELRPQVESFFAARGWACRLSAKVHVGPVVAGDFGPPSDLRFDIVGRAVNHTVKLPATGVSVSDEARQRLSPDVRRLLELEQPRA